MPTTRVQLSKTAWTSLGNGPMFLQNTRDRAEVHWALSDADPGNGGGDIADVPQNVLGGSGAVADINITFTGQVWARGFGTVNVTK